MHRVLNRLLRTLGPRYVDLLAAFALLAGATVGLVPVMTLNMLYELHGGIVSFDAVMVSLTLVVVGVSVAATREPGRVLRRFLAGEPVPAADVLMATYEGQAAYHRTALKAGAVILLPAGAFATTAVIEPNGWQLLVVAAEGLGIGLCAGTLSWAMANVVLAPIRRRLRTEIELPVRAGSTRPVAIIADAVHDRLGARLPLALGVLTFTGIVGLAPTSVGVATLFFNVSTSQGLMIGLIVAGIAATASRAGLAVCAPVSRPLRRWLAGERDQDLAADAWRAAVNLPWIYERANWTVAPFGIVGGGIAIGAILDLNTAETGAVCGAGFVVGICGNIVAYLVVDALLGPARRDIGRELPVAAVSDVARVPIAHRMIGAALASQLIAIAMATVVVGDNQPFARVMERGAFTTLLPRPGGGRARGARRVSYRRSDAAPDGSDRPGCSRGLRGPGSGDVQR